jgi:hypothetical protein
MGHRKIGHVNIKQIYVTQSRNFCDYTQVSQRQMGDLIRKLNITPNFKDQSVGTSVTQSASHC